MSERDAEVPEPLTSGAMEADTPVFQATRTRTCAPAA